MWTIPQLSRERDPKSLRSRREARLELLDSLLEQTRSQIAEFKIPGDASTLTEELARLEGLFEEATTVLQAEQTVASAEAREARGMARPAQGGLALDVLTELQQRFFTPGGSIRIRFASAPDDCRSRRCDSAEMNEERCPICGSPAQYHDREHGGRKVEPETTWRNACGGGESAKIQVLLRDLAKTIQRDRPGNHRTSNKARKRRARPARRRW